MLRRIKSRGYWVQSLPLRGIEGDGKRMRSPFSCAAVGANQCLTNQRLNGCYLSDEGRAGHPQDGRPNEQ